MDEVSFAESDSQETIQETPNEEVLTSGNPFLNEVAVQHRDTVAPYLKKWDANATKKFQEYSAKLKPYEALGAPDEVQRYVNFARNFRQDPENMFRLMWQGLQEQHGDQFQQELLRILQIEEAMNEQQQEQNYESGSEPDPNEVFQQNVTEELEEFRAFRDEQIKQAQFQEEQRQLDTVLETMHNRYGEFDESWIIMKIAEHGNPDQAIKEWNSMVGKYGSKAGAQRQAPKVMGGQGGVPSEQVNTAELRGKDRRNMVANMLQSLGD